MPVRAAAIDGPTEERVIVKGRSLHCHWEVHEPGMSMMDVARRLCIAVPKASDVAKRVQRVVRDEGLLFADILNVLK